MTQLTLWDIPAAPAAPGEQAAVRRCCATCRDYRPISDVGGCCDARAKAEHPARFKLLWRPSDCCGWYKERATLPE